MKTKNLIMYVIVSKHKQPEIYTLKTTKKESIAQFLNGGRLMWKDVKKYGWRCIKVDVVIQETLNF